MLRVVAEVRMQPPDPPLGPQEVVNSVLCRKAPSDVLESNFLVLFRVEQLKHKKTAQVKVMRPSHGICILASTPRKAVIFLSPSKENEC